MPRQFFSPNQDPLRQLHYELVRASLEEPLKDHPWPWRPVRNQSHPWCYDVEAKDGHVVEHGLSLRTARRICALARKVTEGKQIDASLDAFERAMKNRRRKGKRKS